MTDELTLGQWLKHRRRQLDLTQHELAQQVGCSVAMIRKIEQDARRPSKQLAELMATRLEIPLAQQAAFITFARTDAYMAPMPDVLTILEETAAEPPPLPATTTAVASHTPALTPNNLPPQATSFIGREQELANLDQLIADPKIRMVTIVAPGGMGKTRLGLAVAEQYVVAGGQTFPNGVYFVNLAPLSEVSHMVPAVADALNFPLQGGDGRSPQQQLLDYLRQKEMLLLFDNFEHLLSPPPASPPLEGIRGGEDLLADILQAAPKVQVLVTSRERLYLRMEQVYPIEGLEFPDWETLKDAEEYTAVQLFLQSARRNQPDFALHDKDDLTYLTHICRTVAGMPLALELATSWVDMLSLAEIASELQQGLDFLGTDMRDMPERHRSIRATIDYSWQKLAETERDIFAKLSVFRGGFTREAAKAVTGANLRQLARLVSKSLLRVDSGNGRYQIHELLRQYGAERLQESGEETAVRYQHSLYYCTEVGKRASDLRGLGQQTALAQIEADKNNVWGAWRWAAQQKHWFLLDTAANALNWFYLLRGRYEEGEAICRQISADIDIVAFESSTTIPRILAQILVWQGNFAWILGDREAGVAYLQQSLALLEEQSQYDREAQLAKAHALLILGLYSDYYDADLDSARDRMEQSLALYRTADDQWGEAWCLRYLGTTLQRLNFKDIARKYLEHSLTLFKAIGDTTEIAMSLSFLCYRAIVEGKYKEAEKLGQESLLSNEIIGSAFGEAQSMNILAWTALAQGQLTQADNYFQEVLRVTYDMGDIFNSFPAIIGQSCIQLHRGKYERARTLAQEAFTLKRSQHRYNRYFLSALGDAALGLGEYDVARRYLQENVDVLTSGEEHFLIEARGVLGVTLLKLGYPDQARQQFYKALQLALHNRSYSMPFLLAGIAVFLADYGDGERAIALYALAESQPLIAQSRWFADVYGRSVAMVSASLPSDIAKRATGRGKNFDLWQTAESLLSELSWGEEAEGQRRFVKEALLAKGGFGEVYRGRDRETGLVVVIKRLKPELVAQQPEVMARFVREGELLRQLNHPNIVQMLASEEMDGEQCLIMEYVAGGSLRDLLDKDGRLSVARTLDIALELADALSRAHHLDIIHRDLKPGNVLLAVDGTPRLTDFGIARMTQLEGTQLTQAGAMVGTVDYMSPEACQGLALDGRSDIWSFGILMYEMLTGTLPFQGEQITATILAIISVSTPDLLVLRPDVPAALVRLIERMLVKDPAGRISQMRQVAADLERIRQGL